MCPIVCALRKRRRHLCLAREIQHAAAEFDRLFFSSSRRGRSIRVVTGPDWTTTTNRHTYPSAVCHWVSDDRFAAAGRVDCVHAATHRSIGARLSSPLFAYGIVDLNILFFFFPTRSSLSCPRKTRSRTNGYRWNRGELAGTRVTAVGVYIDTRGIDGGRRARASVVPAAVYNSVRPRSVAVAVVTTDRSTPPLPAARKVNAHTHRRPPSCPARWYSLSSLHSMVFEYGVAFVPCRSFRRKWNFRRAHYTSRP